MKKEMIFGYFLQISNHMWPDAENTLPEYAGQDPWDVNNNIDWEVWDEMIDFIAERKYNLLIVDVGDGVILKSHPEIAAPDALTVDELKEKLQKVRDKGIEVIPKLNFSACHCAWQKEWRAKIGYAEQYLQFAKDVIKEVFEIFDRPRFFHLGLDEEGWGTQKDMSVCVIRNEEFFWKEITPLFDYCKELGTRPVLFADMIWHREAEYLAHMPQEVIQSNWYYGAHRGNEDAVPIKAYRTLNEKGFDQLPTLSSYSSWLSPEDAMGYLYEKLDPDHLLGFITIPWHNTTRLDQYSLMADADLFYQARQKIFPETL